MPVYEYRCSACNREFEYQQRMSEDPKQVCEACGGKLERLISKSAFQLKGGGWYKDLYSSQKPAEPAGGDGGDKKPETKAPAETKSDAPAPAAAAPAAPAASGTSSGSGSGTGSGSGSGSGSGTGSGSSGGTSSAAAAPTK